MGSQTSRRGRARPATLSLVGILLTLSVALLLSACTTTTVGNGRTSATATTDTGTPTTTTDETPTATTGSGGGGGGGPTATPAPVLQGQVITQSFGAIGANTNSTILDLTCPAGYLVAGGGINSGYTSFTTMWNAPISTTKWRAEIFNNSGSTIYAQVQVMCLKAPGLTGQVVIQGMGAIGGNTNSTIVDIACPAGYLVAGGGINSGYTDFTTMWSAPISTTKFRAEIFNRSGSTIYAQAQVMCLQAPGLTEQLAIQSFGAIGGNTNSTIIDVACPAGYLVAGGGINSGYTNFTTMWNAPISTTKFRAELYNRTSGTIYAQAQVPCMKLA